MIRITSLLKNSFSRSHIRSFGADTCNDSSAGSGVALIATPRTGRDIGKDQLTEDDEKKGRDIGKEAAEEDVEDDGEAEQEEDEDEEEAEEDDEQDELEEQEDKDEEEEDEEEEDEEQAHGTDDRSVFSERNKT